MTVLVALETGTGTLIGFNDGAVLDETPVAGDACPWITFGDWALGVSGEAAVQWILAAGLKDQAPRVDTAEALIVEIARVLSDSYVGQKKDENAVLTYGFSGILAHRAGGLWDVSDCLSLTRIPAGQLWAQGSGRFHARGAWYALERAAASLPAPERMRLALEAAIANDIYCVGAGIVRPL